MSLSIKGILYAWYHQVSHAIQNQYDHIDPQFYAIGLVLCICIGWVLLNGRT